MQEEFNSFSKSVTSIKALAIFSIILVHQDILESSFDDSNRFFYVFIKYADIGADIFTILSGIMLSISIINTKDISLKEWYKKRLIKIYPILIIIVLFIVVYDFFFFEPFISFEEKRNVNSNLILMSGIHTIIYKRSLRIPPSLWFIPFILSCYLIFPIIFYSLKKNFKLTVIFGILLYITFIIFSFQLYLFTRGFVGDEQDRGHFIGFFPRYFEFFFGVVFGFWIGNNNLNRLLDKRIELMTFIILIIFTFLGIFLNFYENDEIFPNGTLFLIKFLCYPMISFSFIFFFVNFNRNKIIINKILEFPGKESFEIFLINDIAIHIVYFLFIPVNLIGHFFHFLLSIIACILLATPFYYLNRRMTREKKINDFLITISISLIIYAFIFFLIWRIVDFTNTFSIILIGIIFVVIINNNYNIQKHQRYKKIKNSL